MDNKGFRGIFNFGKKEKRSVDDGFVPGYYADGSLMFGSLSNSQYSATNLPTAYRCINLISDTIASMPIAVKKRSAKGKTLEVKNHPINLLFADKNSRTDKFTFIKMLIQSVICKGNGFAYIKRAQDGTPIKLIFLESSDVTINYMKETDTLYYQVGFIKNGSRIEPYNMLHFKMFSNNGVQGISLLANARRTLSLAAATDSQAKSFFENGASLNGIINSTTQLSAKQRQEILSSWNTTYSNGGRGIAVLQGNLSYQPISLNAADSQMVEARQLNNTDIATFFGVPAAMLNIKGFSSYSSLEDTQNFFLTTTLLPYIKMMETEFDKKLLKDNETNLKVIFDSESILRTNKTALADYYTKLVTNGLMTANEARQQLGLPSIDGADSLIIPFTDVNQNTINKDEIMTE